MKIFGKIFAFAFILGGIQLPLFASDPISIRDSQIYREIVKREQLLDSESKQMEEASGGIKLKRSKKKLTTQPKGEAEELEDTDAQ